MTTDQHRSIAGNVFKELACMMVARLAGEAMAVSLAEEAMAGTLAEAATVRLAGEATVVNRAEAGMVPGGVVALAPGACVLQMTRKIVAR
jgi:hypothetical protein